MHCVLVNPGAQILPLWIQSLVTGRLLDLI